MVGGSVNTTYGPVRGIERDGLQVFRGVRYAAPPVGDRRFRPPVAPEPWTDVAECAHAGPTAPQNPGGLEAMMGAKAPAQSEDCLFLNVWTPGCDDARRPVMVWIHGGAFVSGSGTIPWYDGSSFARRHDVVVVTLNYRLGVLGFSHLADLGGDGFASSGNLGILDQAFALEWVRDNIAGFGGDPGNVTIFGESAGGMSVSTLLATPAAAGLFHKAIPQSGAAKHVRSREQATETARRLLDHLGVGVEQLRDVPVERLLEAQAAISASTGIEGGLPFSPVHDGTALPERPMDAIGGGAAAGVPLLTGTNADEMLLFTFMDPRVADLDDERLAARAARVFGDEAVHQAVDTYRSTRPGCGPGELWSAVLTDMVFRVPAVQLAEQQAKHAPVYTYLFTWATPAFGGKLGSCHALEIPFVFNVLDGRGIELFTGPVDDEMRRLALSVHDAWAAFARTGDPNHDGLPDWPAFGPPERHTMVLGDACTVEQDPAGHELALWASVP